MARARDVWNRAIVPHRDFLELARPEDRYFRVLVTLEANPACLNSDKTMVFRMRPGEVWFLGAALAHSAINYSSQSRWSLCLDFHLSRGGSPADILRAEGQVGTHDEPEQIHRTPLQASVAALVDIVAATA